MKQVCEMALERMWHRFWHELIATIARTFHQKRWVLHARSWQAVERLRPSLADRDGPRTAWRHCIVASPLLKSRNFSSTPPKIYLNQDQVSCAPLSGEVRRTLRRSEDGWTATTAATQPNDSDLTLTRTCRSLRNPYSNNNMVTW